jgi:large subunit ribosomal protein L30
MAGQAKQQQKQEWFSGITVRTGDKVQIRQARSLIGRSEEVRDTLRALGLGKIGKSRAATVTPAFLGMMRRVASVLEVSVVK